MMTIAPSSPNADLPLAQLLAKQGKVKEAIAAYQQALAKQPDLLEAHLSLGRLFRAQGASENAIAHYRKALQLDPQWQTYQALGETLHQKGAFAEATIAYENAIAIAPEQPALYFQLGLLQDQQGKLKAACESYRRTIALAPDYAPAYSYLGGVLTQRYQLQEGIENLKSAIALHPQKAAYYNNLGWALMQQENSQAAIAAYQQAVTLQPDYLLAHYNLGIALQVEERHEQAAQHFQTVTRLQPNHLAAYGDWGVSLLALGKIEKALQCWETVIKSDLKQVSPYQEWVKHRFHTPQDEWENAKLACFSFLTALQQSNLQEAQACLREIYRQFADAALRYGVSRQAKRYYQKALALQTEGEANLAQQPHHPRTCFALGKLLEKEGDWKSAIACYQQILSHQSQNKVEMSSTGCFPPPQRDSTARSWLANNKQLDNNHYIELRPEETFEEATANNVQPAECRGLECASCLKTVSQWFQPVQIEAGIHTCSFPQAPPVTYSPLFVARIPQGRAWATPQENHWLICKALAVITPDNHFLSDVSRDYPGQLPPCVNPTRHQIFQQETLPPLKQIDGAVAVLAGLSGTVYFHWFVDVLPRLALLRQAGIEPNQLDGLWLNRMSHPFQRETLEILGLSPEKVIASDDHPHIQAKQLIVPSFAGHLGWLPPWGLKFLRRAFLAPLRQPQKSYPERIYIRRDGARHRRVLNEEAVIAYLSTRGFVPVSLETLSFPEQLNWFASAKVIVAPHGSGLTNLAFCAPKTKVIEFFSPSYVRHYFWVISQQLGLEHYFLVGETITCRAIRELMYQNPLSEDIWVDLTALKKVLDRCLND